MSKEIILNALDGIQDRYITEAAGKLGLLNGSASALNRRRESALSRFFGSGWGVAMICAVVSLSVLGGIVWAGQRPAAGPQDTATESETVVETEAETDTETEVETETETTTPIESETSEELLRLFEMLQSNDKQSEKISFYIVDQDLHYELKASGEYANSEWAEPEFVIQIGCAYELAVDEVWYQQCAEKDTRSLNQAFYDHHQAGISNGEYTNSIYHEPGMALSYSIDVFDDDYSAIMALADLNFVTHVNIGYYYGLPFDYLLE